MISREAEAFWAAIKAAPRQIDLPLDKRRAAGELAETATSEPSNVRYEDAPGVGGFWVGPEAGKSDCTIVYLFGGGYVLGSPASRRKTAGHLALAANARVLVPNYRLAPEHRYPAALDDAVAGYEFAARVAGEMPILIAGDSAGGGLAIALGLVVRDRALTAPAGIVALSPWADLTCSGETMAQFADRDIECSRDGLLDMARQYLGTVSAREPLASPIFGDFAAMPPFLCVVGSEEVLLDDSLRLARAVAQSGGSAAVSIGAGMQHVYPIWVGAFPEAGVAMSEVGSWIRKRVESLARTEAAKNTRPACPIS